MSSTSLSSFTPSPDHRSPLDVKPKVMDFQSVAAKIGVAAVGPEATKDPSERLIGVNLDDKTFVYFKPNDYKRVVNEQIKMVLEAEKEVLEDALSNLQNPKDIRTKVEELAILKKDTAGKFRNHSNQDIRAIVKEIDALRSKLTSGIQAQHDEELDLMSAYLPADETAPSSTFPKSAAAKTQKPSIGLSGETVSASAAKVSTAVTAQKTNWFVAMIKDAYAALQKFFGTTVPLDVPIQVAHKYLEEHNLTRGYFTKENIRAVVTVAASEKKRLERLDERVKEGNPAFNAQLDYESTAQYKRLLDKLDKAEELARSSDEISSIPVDQDLSDSMASAKAMFQRLVTSTKNCLKKVTTPQEKQILQQTLIEAESALYQIAHVIDERNFEIRLDKAPDSDALLKIVKSLPEKILGAATKKEFEDKLETIKKDLPQLEAEATLLKSSIKAVEKEMSRLKDKKDSAQYKPLLHFLREQLNEVQLLRADILSPILSPLKAKLRELNFKEDPENRDIIRQFVARSVTINEMAAKEGISPEQLTIQIEEIQAKKSTYIFCTGPETAKLRNFENSIAAKLSTPDAIERNPMFKTALDEMTSLSSQMFIENESTPKSKSPHTAEEREKARINAFLPHEKIRASLGILRRDLMDEIESRKRDPNALILVAGKVYGEDNFGVAFSEMSEYEAIQKNKQTNVRAAYDLTHLSVDQYMAYRKNPDKALLISPSQDITHADFRINYAHNKDLACYAYVKDKLSDRSISAEQRAFLEKDFLQLEKSLSMPRYATIESHLIETMEKMQQYAERFAIDALLNPPPNYALSKQGIDLYDHTIQTMLLLEIAFEKELDKMHLPASERAVLMDKLIVLRQMKDRFEETFGEDVSLSPQNVQVLENIRLKQAEIRTEFRSNTLSESEVNVKDKQMEDLEQMKSEIEQSSMTIAIPKNQVNKMAAQFVLKSLASDWITPMQAKLAADKLTSLIRVNDMGIAHAREIADIATDPSKRGSLMSGMKAEVPAELIANNLLFRSAKAHLDLLMPSIQENDDEAFSRAFLQTEGGPVYCNRETGEYSTTQKQRAFWYSLSKEDSAEKMLKILQTYAEKGFHSLGFTKELSNSKIIQKQFPEFNQRTLQNSISVREFALAYKQSIETGYPVWSQKNGDVYTYTCSSDKPKGANWTEVNSWEATLDAVHLYNEYATNTNWDDYNPLMKDLHYMSEALAQLSPTVMETDINDVVPLIQSRIAHFQSQEGALKTTQQAESRLKEIAGLIFVLKKAVAIDENLQDPAAKYLNNLLQITGEIRTMIKTREDQLILDIRNYSENSLALGIYRDLSSLASEFRHNFDRYNANLGAVFIPVQAGKNAHWPEATLDQMREILKNPIDGKLIAPDVPHEFRAPLARSKALAALIAIEKLLLKDVSSEDKLFLREKHTAIKNLLLNELDPNTTQKISLASRVTGIIPAELETPKAKNSAAPIAPTPLTAAEHTTAVAAIQSPTAAIPARTEADDINFADAFIKAKGKTVWQNSSTGEYSITEKKGPGWNKLSDAEINARMRDLISTYAGKGFEDIQKSLYFAYSSIVSQAASKFGSMRALEAMREAIEIREFAMDCADSLRTGDPVWKNTLNSAGVDIIRYECNPTKPPKGNWIQLTRQQTALQAMHYLRLHADIRELTSNNPVAIDLYKMAEAAREKHPVYSNADLSNALQFIKSEFEKFQASIPRTSQEIESRASDMLALQGLVLKAEKEKRISSADREQFLDWIPAPQKKKEPSVMESTPTPDKFKAQANAASEAPTPIDFSPRSPEKLKKWKESVTARETQYRTFIQDLKGKTPAELLEWVKANRISLSNYFDNGWHTINDRLNMPGTTMEDSSVALLEESNRLKLFLTELKKASKSEDVAILVQRFLNDPEAFSMDHFHEKPFVDTSKMGMLLGNRPTRLAQLQGAAIGMAEVLDGIKRLNMSLEEHIKRLTEFRARFKELSDVYKEFNKPGEADPNLIKELDRLTDAIPRAIEDKRNSYKFKHGIPLDGGNLKAVTVADVRAASAKREKAAQLKAKEQAKLPPKTPSDILASITKQLSEPTKNHLRISKQLDELKQLLKDPKAQLSNDEIAKLRKAFAEASSKNYLESDFGLLYRKFEKLDFALKVLALKNKS